MDADGVGGGAPAMMSRMDYTSYTEFWRPAETAWLIERGVAVAGREPILGYRHAPTPGDPSR